VLVLALTAASCDSAPDLTIENTAHAQPASGGEPASHANVFGLSDESVRNILRASKIEKVKRGSGGRSLAFKLWFRDGVRGYFKPEQTFAANWYSEAASYYLDRELGLGRAPPAIGRRIDWSQLRRHAANDWRLGEVVVKDGHVRGSVVWWIPDPPPPIALSRGWESWLRIEPAEGPSPFQRPGDYFKARRRGSRASSQKPSEPHGDRAAELSDLIVFDYLIGNLDRWSDDFTNVRTLGKDKALIYLDNANGFELRDEPSRILEARLTFVQRFRKKTISAIRGLNVDAFERRMAADPLAPLLGKPQLEALEVRRRRVLEYVAQMETMYGVRALPW
jgi:hypothetical protein